MKTTGEPNASAPSINPPASAGVEGTTTLSPGMCASQPHRLCSCCPPSPYPPPQASRTTRGACQWPPENVSSLAAWLSSASAATPRKSAIITSTTGRSPAIEAATDAPTNAASLMGVLRTRSRPKRTNNPLCEACTSSPNRMTRGSAAMACPKASSIASEYRRRPRHRPAGHRPRLGPISSGRRQTWQMS